MGRYRIEFDLLYNDDSSGPLSVLDLENLRDVALKAAQLELTAEQKKYMKLVPTTRSYHDHYGTDGCARCNSNANDGQAFKVSAEEVGPEKVTLD